MSDIYQRYLYGTRYTFGYSPSMYNRYLHGMSRYSHTAYPGHTTGHGYGGSANTGTGTTAAGGVASFGTDYYDYQRYTRGPEARRYTSYQPGYRGNTSYTGYYYGGYYYH